MADEKKVGPAPPSNQAPMVSNWDPIIDFSNTISDLSLSNIL